MLRESINIRTIQCSTFICTLFIRVHFSQAPSNSKLLTVVAMQLMVSNLYLIRNIKLCLVSFHTNFHMLLLTYSLQAFTVADY
jgi:hypothetical protein